MVVMTMRTYARIQSGIVAELLRTNGDIKSMFHSSLTWVDVSARPDVAEGWHFDGTSFSRPAPVAAQAPAPTVAELQVQLAAIGARLETLANRH